MAKSRTVEVATRIDMVATMILENDKFLRYRKNPELVLKVMEKFGVKKRQADFYIEEAKKEIRKIAAVNKVKALKKALREREYLLRKAKGLTPDEKPNLKLALEVMKDRDKLLGLYVEQVEHSGQISLKDIDTSRLTDEQLKQLKNLIKVGGDYISYLKSIGLIK